MQRGATLLAEDVLVVDDSSGRLTVEPGSAMMNLTEDESSGTSSDDLVMLGEIVGQSHGKLHLIIPRDDRPTPLAIMYLLERAEHGLPLFETVSDVGAAQVFPNTFVNYIYRPERMIRQLEIAAQLARTVPVVRLRVQPGWTAERLAVAVEEHAEAML
jgi:hypothetical protein